MHVRVRLFAALRERAGAREIELELPSGALVSDALAQMRPLIDDMRVVMAVNREYAAPDTVLAPDDEVALIPPVSGGSVQRPVSGGSVQTHVSGGSTQTLYAQVTEEPLSLQALSERVRNPHAGAVVTFTGVTREVPELEYEAYAEMAQSQLEEIGRRALEHHGLCAVAVEHRLGKVALSEASVAVAVSAPHRGEAFAGAREIIDELKAQAPIWKKEEGEWVKGATPAGKP